MAMKLSEALAQLDPKNDEHWTDDGLPAVEAVQTLYGKEVNRATITRSAPQLTRTSAEAATALITDDDDLGTSDEPKPDDEAVDQDALDEAAANGDGEGGPEKPDAEGNPMLNATSAQDGASGEALRRAVEDMVEAPTRPTPDQIARSLGLLDLDELEPAERLRRFEAAIAELNAARDDITAALDHVQALRDGLVEANEVPQTTLTDAVQDYFRAQDADRAGNAQRVAMLREVLGQPTTPGQGGSPLDQSMTRKTGFGQTRPEPRQA